MRFIFKAVFWFAVVLLLLPDNSPKTSTDQVDRSIRTGTIGSASEIRNLATRLQSVCEENPELCVSSLDNMSMVAAMLGYQAASQSFCIDDNNQ
ncbi:MAG: hypothetical protein GY933_06665 [Hyphomicrobiales bacterium]|nr:hypothetical protein [Hyphomicrobiales bacterium]